MLTYFVSLPRYTRLYKVVYLLVVYFSDAARASGITVIIKGADVDEVFTKLVFQAMSEVQVVHTFMINIFNNNRTVHSAITAQYILQDLPYPTRRCFVGSPYKSISK